MAIILILLIIIAGGVTILLGIVQTSHTTLKPLNLPQNNRHNLVRPGLGAISFPVLRQILERTGLNATFKKNIDAAHARLTPQLFFLLKILIGIILFVFGIISVGKFNPFLIILIFIGYVLPDIYLKIKIAKRKAQIIRVMPETIDLLGLCIEAGLDFTNAVKWVIEKTPSTPLVEELAFVLEEIKWGKPRVQALRDMSRRLDIPEVTSFVQTIIQAERMGTPVAEAFTILSEDSRMQRFHRGERIALQAPIKILFPLIFFIMPVIGIVVGGPILLQFMYGGLLPK
ncbi:MAG: type II secretion system F family protein [Candidatus Omnitrophota bacterium]|jgi:tight adherence protein C